MSNPLQDRILQLLDQQGTIPDTLAIHDDQNEVSGVLRSLESRDMVAFTQIDKEHWNLTEEARNVVEKGSPEAMLYEAVVKSMGGLKISEITVRRFLSSRKPC